MPPLRGPTAVSHVHPTAPPVTEVATAQPSAWEPIHLSPELKRTILRSGLLCGPPQDARRQRC